MEPTLSSGAGSGNSGTYTPEIAESLRFEEEIQSLMRLEPPAAGGGSSFTALLGLPANQAVELLHEPESVDPQAPSSGTSAGAGAGEGWLFRLRDTRGPRFPLPCSPPTFPTNATLVERAARFSVFAAEDSPEAALSESPSASGDLRLSPRPKVEPPDSDANPPISGEGGPQQRAAKRKEAEKSKAKASAKKSKAAEEITAAAEEKERLPYVHVRARRGQATDSHSLAERARREKINARMKLLQELVPGCSKISGTALVLDEIINHVQSLQRQVEFLSMRLAAVNPRIDFSGLDSFLSAECGRVTAGNVTVDPAAWPGPAVDGGARPPQEQQQQQQQQIWHVDLMQPQQAAASPPSLSMWERSDTAPRVFVSPGSSIFGYDPANRPNPVVTLHSSQLKTEL